MQPLNHPYRILQRHSWRLDSPWRILKPMGAGRPYVPLAVHENGAERMFTSYAAAINYLIDQSHISLNSPEAARA